MLKKRTATAIKAEPAKSKKRGKLGLLPMFKTLLKSLRNYRKNAWLCLGFSTAQALFECLIPLVMMILINRLSELNAQNMTSAAQIMPTVGIFAAILLVLAVFSFISSYLAAKHSAIAAVGLAANIRQDLFYRTTEFSFENIDRFSKASLVTRTTTDVFNIQNAFLMIIRFGILAPFTIIFSLVCTFVVGWQLSWIYCIVLPLIVASLSTIIFLATKIYTKAFPKFDEINKIVEENVRGIRTVKSYTREEFEDKKFKDKAAEIKQLMTKGEIYGGLTNPVLVCTINISLTLFISLGSLAFIDGIIDIGNFQALISYGINTLTAVMMVAFIAVNIAMSFASGKRVCEVLNEVPTLTNPQNGCETIENGSIEFDDVHFSFRDKRGDKLADEECLKGINLKIASGEVIGIIGGTGSAKSTLVNMIPRFYDPQIGTVKVAGRDVRSYDLVPLRDSVSMVLQKNVLFSGTLRDNMRWGDPQATDAQIDRALAIACASEFVDQLPGRLDYIVDQGGANFSGGQKQRLCIARAILKSPKVLIFDDSTSAVDTKTDKKIRNSLRESIPGVTKIIVAQRISSVADADRVIVMDDGRVVDFDTPSHLFDSSRIFREVCDLQGVKKEELR